MPLEEATYIQDLVTSNPAGGDDRSTADDHLRLIKFVLKETFPNANGAINPTVAEFNKLVGLTASTAEMNYLAGVTSAIQTQLNAKLSTSGLLAAILAVDGSGSGIDADTVDGVHAASFLLSASYTAADVLAKLLTVDGAASALDADLLDGQHGAYYLDLTNATGTLADARFPATLPAVSGVNLTALNATQLLSGTVPAARLPANVALLDAAANFTAGLQIGGLDVGFKGLPQTSGAWVNGKCRVETAGVTLDDADVTTDNIYSVYNNSDTPITITQGSGVTLRLMGTTTTGNLTLAERGMATIWCRTGTEAIAAGALS